MVELAQRLVRDDTALLEESAPAFPVIDPRAGEGPGAPAPAGEGVGEHQLRAHRRRLLLLAGEDQGVAARQTPKDLRPSARPSPQSRPPVANDGLETVRSNDC